MPRLNKARMASVQLGEHLAPFKSLCDQYGVSMAHVFRRFVADQLKINSCFPTKGIPFGSRISRPKVVTIRLTEAEASAASRFALAENIPISNWFVQRLQDAMAEGDEMKAGRQELREFAKSIDKLQRDMVGMCINLNQVARKVNSRVDPKDKISPERLLVLKQIEQTMFATVKQAQSIIDRVEHPRRYPYAKSC